MSILDRYPEFLDPAVVEAYGFDDCWTRTHPSASYEERDVVAALIHTQGNYSKMAVLLGRSRRSVENHVQRDINLRDLRDDIRNTILDAIEDGYITDALQGDAQARRFFLQTLGKDRGYVVRSESTGRDGGPIHLQSRIDATKLSEAALAEILAAGSQ